MNVSTTKATLSFSDSDEKIELPVYKGSLGPDVIDIRKLYGQFDLLVAIGERQRGFSR